MAIVTDLSVRRRRSRLVVAGVALGMLAMALVAGAIIVGAVRPGDPNTPTVALAAPHFIEEARAAGLDQVYDGDFDYFVGGGAAAFDCNADGKPELYLAGGSGTAGLFVNESPIGGALRFTRLSDPATDLSAVMGAYPLDIDSDGIPDLVVLRNGENVLLHGTGNCHFERANEKWGFEGGTDRTTAFSATWEAGAALPTLAIGNYEDANFTDPNKLCETNQLVRPAATGAGYAPPLPLTPSWCALSMLFTDWNHTGQRDLRISNDHHYYSDESDGQEEMWHVTAGQQPRLYTKDDGWQLLRIWGMGIASQDLDGDGRPEVFLSNQADNMLQTLVTGASGPQYRDISRQSGTTATHPYTGPDTASNSTAWHSQFEDVNNDGFVDLFVAKGNVEAMSDFAAQDPPDLLLGQPNGIFVEGAMDAGIVDFARGRGAAVADFNLDGLPDIVEVTRRENVRLWRNAGSGNAAAAAAGHWAEVRLDQAGLNRDAIGAWVTIKIGQRTIAHEVTVGGGHAGGQLGWIHFGLGSATTAELQVQWPDGDVGPWLSLPADAFATIERGADVAQPWTPAGQP